MKHDAIELWVFLKIIGDNVKAMRLKENKDIATVAVDTGIPVDDLFDLEAGNSARMNPGYLVILADYFKVDFSEMFEGW
jgi:hypothetical protein